MTKSYNTFCKQGYRLVYLCTQTKFIFAVWRSVSAKGLRNTLQKIAGFIQVVKSLNEKSREQTIRDGNITLFSSRIEDEGPDICIAMSSERWCQKIASLFFAHEWPSSLMQNYNLQNKNEPNTVSVLTPLRTLGSKSKNPYF